MVVLTPSPLDDFCRMISGCFVHQMQYHHLHPLRRCGMKGLSLPPVQALSLGMDWLVWQEISVRDEHKLGSVVLRLTPQSGLGLWLLSKSRQKAGLTDVPNSCALSTISEFYPIRFLLHLRLGCLSILLRLQGTFHQ